jgi:predicted cupin superfamily sugar epimerase
MHPNAGHDLARWTGTRECAGMTDAQALIARLDLAPHPEGGWYRETWRADARAGTRGTATAILFLLEEGQRSHWHRVDAAELWLWHAGAPLDLKVAPDDSGPITTIILGGDVLAGQTPQCVVPTDHWQAAEADRGWTLVSCVVSPAFDFAGFTLAAEGWAPGR